MSVLCIIKILYFHLTQSKGQITGKLSGSISNPNNSEPALISIKTHGKALPKLRDAKQLALCNQINKIEPKFCKKILS